MLLSMTGFGTASGENERFRASVELKAVNNRYLKVSVRVPDMLGSLEPEFERQVRESVARGTVSVFVRFAPLGRSSRYRLAPEVVGAYWQQLKEITAEHRVPMPASAVDLLSLPGAVSDELGTSVDCDAEWPLLQQVLSDALNQMQGFRRREGEAMRNELTDNCRLIAERLSVVRERAPHVVSTYRDKVLDRVRELLRNSGATVTEENLIREVSIFADRCDINEEITRLQCHIDEFIKVMDDRQSQGRKLDFLVQEMFREINTTGSKASDIEISHCVVEMKVAAEKMREILQNVE